MQQPYDFMNTYASPKGKPVGARKSYFERELENFHICQSDKEHSPKRGKIYSYGKLAKSPVIFRHYQHFLAPLEQLTIGARIQEDFYTLFILVDTKFNAILNNNFYATSCGDILILRPGDSFEPIYFVQDNIDYFEFNVPSCFFEYFDNVSPFHKLFFSKEDEIFNISSVSKEGFAELFHILSRIDALSFSDNENKDYLLFSYFTRLISFLCSNHNKGIASSGSGKPGSTILKATQYITQNYLSISGIDEVADYCHVSVSYLCRVFKNKMQMTPVEFINSRKLICAQYLLKNSHSVIDACFGSGFNSYNHFVATFKKNFGITPVKYKKTEAERK